MRTKTLMTALLGGALIGAPVGYLAATAGRDEAPAHVASRPMNHASMGHAGGSETEATRAFAQAAARMHSAMASKPTGDVDLDFAQGMIPHHAGAVDMARIELRHGTDPTMRKLARTVIETQTTEMETMGEWIEGRGGRKP